MIKAAAISCSSDRGCLCAVLQGTATWLIFIGCIFIVSNHRLCNGYYHSTLHSTHSPCFFQRHAWLLCSNAKCQPISINTYRHDNLIHIIYDTSEHEVQDECLLLLLIYYYYMIEPAASSYPTPRPLMIDKYQDKSAQPGVVVGCCELRLRSTPRFPRPRRRFACRDLAWDYPGV